MQKTNLNISPIFDDFNELDNYYRVLFNSGRSVQARELTQAQTILQSQIERVGKHLFTEGSMVVPGGIRAIEQQPYLTFTLSGGATFATLSAETDLYVQCTVNNMIYKIAKLMDAVNADPMTAFADFISPGSNQEKTFLNGQVVNFFVYNSNGTQRNVASGTITGTGNGSWVKVQSGVYFIRGTFVRTDAQDFVVSKYNTSTTKKVGFQVNESIVTSDMDPALLSNANGFTNQNAPGASRLKITLTLTGLDIGTESDSFIEIARFDGGALASEIDYTQYSIIQQAIARQIYETNGDFTVNAFGLDIKEHLNNGSNNGVYTAADGGDSTKLVAAVRPGVAYVKGYRAENIGIQNVPFDKARDTAFLNNASAAADYGQYFLCQNVLSLPDIDIKKQILLLDSTNTQVGTARVRSIRKDGTQYRFYVFDIAINNGKTIANVAHIKYTDASSLFTADLVSSALYDANKGSLLFKLPVNAVKSLFQSGVGSDTTYTVLRSFTLTTNSSGTVSASVGSNEFFGAVDGINWFIALTGSASAGTQFDPTTTVTLGGTIQGTTATIALGAGQANQTIKVIAPVLKSATTQRTKTLLTVNNEAISFPDTNRQRFANTDIYDILSVKDASTNADITSLFTFDNGQRDSWYESGRLVTKDGNLITRNVLVSYRYFSASAGDYFTVDSYSGLTREQIPSYNGNNLADYIDFRPLKDNADNFTSATVSGEILKPASTISADITYYLPRTDIIVLEKDGSFKDIRGIPSLTPATPSTPDEAMKLFELYIPAYTMSPSDVAIKTVDNKRYTMRDIGKLDARIANLEYYTTLNALETATNKTNVIDPVTGNNRFKNGLAVDGFADYSMADVQNPEWSASLDLDNRLCKTSFKQNAVGFPTSAMSGVVEPTSVFMKSYTEAAVVTQPYATRTINVNPYAVYAWAGNVTLTPDRDYWKDVIYNQPIIINNTINLRGSAVEGYVWGSWIKTTYDEVGGHRAWAQYQYKQYQYYTEFQQKTYNSGTSDSVVSTQVIPYMRTIWIAFTLKNFRPFTRVYPRWDNVDISQWCEPSGGSMGQALVTDANGALNGWFLVPTGTFRTGESVISFTDDVSADPNVQTTWGSTNFMSGGVTETRQTTTTNTTVLTATTTATGAVNYQDPIAQTFTIPTDGGAFISRFDIFFASKSLSIPVTIELRTAYAGFPTSVVLARKTLNPNQVNTSTDGSVPTSFIFNDPVYLQDGQEYAVVVLANTQDYNVYIAQQGQDIIGVSAALSKQAYTGVFLTSSNSSTWTAEQDKDMKFTIWRAVYDTSSSGTLTLSCDAPTALPLQTDALYTTSGSSTVVVRKKQHGLHVGDAATISGAVGGNGLTAAQLNGTWTVIAADIDTFSFAASSSANATGSLGGGSMTVLVFYPFNLLVNNCDAFTPSGTTVTWEYQYVTQVNRTQSAWLPFSPGANTTLPVEGVVKAAGDLKIRATLTTTKDNLSPQIESSGFNAVLVTPRVDPSSNVFNYVSTDIKFNNPTTQANFYVGARLPNGSGMRFYVKVLNTSDQDVPSTAWTELIATTPIANSDSYVEYQYKLTGNFVGYKIKVALTGSRDNPPDLSDVRSLAFA